MRVGIDTLAAWPSTMSLHMGTLADARGADRAEIVQRMFIDERTVCPPWEDPVTLAVHAARGLLDAEARAHVGLLLVASESGLDQEKPLSTWVQRYLDLPDHCSNLEVKHACYGGTAALQLAAAWVALQPDPQARALVLCTDLSRQQFHKPYEFVMGGGAVALVVKKDPRFLALDPGLRGVFTQEMSDVTRPTSRVEAGHSELSLLSYLDGVDTTFQRYRDQLIRQGGPDLDTVEALRAWMPFHAYHAPFGGITQRAHKALWRCFPGTSGRDANQDFRERVEPGLAFNRRMGGTYASSIFISLLGLADAFGERIDGQRVGVYSYGSGSCAETWSGVFGPQASAIAERAGLRALLDARRPLSVREYEDAERARSAFVDEGDYRTSLLGPEGWYVEGCSGRQHLVFHGVSDWVRQYGWSP